MTEETKKTQASEDDLRRKLLTGTIFGLLGLSAMACDDAEDNIKNKPVGGGGAAGRTGGVAGAGGGTPGGAGRGGSAQGGAGGGASVENQAKALNALLSAEFLAIKTYEAGAGLITNAAADDALISVKDKVLAVAGRFLQQHKDHAAAITAAIKSLSATPVAAADVPFTAPAGLVAVPTIKNVLILATNAEKGAAVAYTQTIAAFGGTDNISKNHRFLAASIGGDESQHFIVLAALVLKLAEPSATLTAETVNGVVPASFVATLDAVDNLNVDGLDKIPNYFTTPTGGGGAGGSGGAGGASGGAGGTGGAGGANGGNAGAGGATLT